MNIYLKPKIFRALKLSTLCLILGVEAGFATESYSQKTTFTISVQDQSVKEVFDYIEQHSEFIIFYLDETIDVNRKVSVNLKDQRVESILEQLFKNTDVMYTINDRQILLSKRKEVTEVAPIVAVVQQKKNTVTGVVLDPTGMPVIGANIMVKGTTSGTITDMDGKFSLDVDKDATLVVSYIGFASQEIKVGNQTKLSISLKEDSEALDELVVVGYGTQKKASLTGAVGAIKGDVVKNTNKSNTIGALQGAIPGMIVTRNSGSPGAEGWDFQIRGASSLNGSTPMLIIDDVPYSDYKMLQNINPNDIENISVLKDASAAIYGARAAGGVVLVTTKKGRETKPTISYSGKVSIKRPGIMVDATSRKEYALMIDEGNKNDNASGGVPSVKFLQDWEYWMNGYKDVNGNDLAVVDHPTLEDVLDFTYCDNDWKKILFGNVIDHAHNISISGSGNKFKYYSSIGYQSDKGLVKGNKNDYKRLNARFTGNYEFSKRFSAELSLALETMERRVPTLINNALSYPSTMPNMAMENPLGQNYAYGGVRNPYIQIRDGGLTKEPSTNYNMKLKFEYKLWKNLKLTTVLARIQSQSNLLAQTLPIKWYRWDGSLWAEDPSVMASQIQKSSTRGINENYSAYLNYDIAFKRHVLNMMVGSSYESDIIDSFWTSRKNLLSIEIPSLNVGNSSEVYNGDEFKEWKIGSFFGRLTYSYDNKYLLEGNVRYDGSSRFLSNNRWKLFGGISAGWIISNEDFIKDLSLDFLKVRSSFGSLGNQNGIGLYDFLQLVNLSSSYYPMGETGERVGITSLGALASEHRSWERINTFNVGLDFAEFDNKLIVNFDYFWKRNQNMLVNTTYPSVIGTSTPTANLGVLKTWGWEANISWHDRIGSVNYTLGINLSDNQNKLIDLDGADNVNLGIVSAREGYPINSIFGYQSGGLLKTEQEVQEYTQMAGTKPNLRVGDMKFLDISGDGKLSPFPNKVSGDSGDLIYLGNTNIRFPFAVTGGINWNNFDISFLIQGVLKKGDLIQDVPASAWWSNQNRFFIGKTYHPVNNPNGKFPALSTTSDIAAWNYQASTFTYYNNSYARLKNLTIGYSLPKDLLTKIGVENVRFYFSGDDILEIVSMNMGYDPETKNTYPLPRYYSFGLDLTF